MIWLTKVGPITLLDENISFNIYIYIDVDNLHNGECASVFNALLKTRRVSAFAFLRGLNMQLLQSRNWLIV